MKNIVLLLTVAVLGCSPAQDEKKVTGDQTSGFVPSTSTSKRKKFVEIPVYVGLRSGSFALDEGEGFGLADVTDFSILLTGCQSGWTTPVTAADPTLNVYKDDRDCLAKLMSYDWEGKTYEPKAGLNFTTWQASDTATFVNNADATDTMEVRVKSTLDNPVSGTEAITYHFYEIANGGSTTVLEDDVGDPHALAVSGQSAPSFTIYSVSYTGTTVTGGGKFVIKLECSANIASSACVENAFANITYKLVEDTYSSAPTLSDARTLFATAGTSITDPTDIIAVGGGGTTHGGFTTVTLDGPDEMHLHPNMILMLRADGAADADVLNDSFTYFNIDVETLSYP